MIVSRTILCCGLSLCLYCLFLDSHSLSSAKAQPNPNAVRAFMRGKLDASQDILEGLVNEDFEKIERGADQLRVMSMRADWNTVEGPEYKQMSAVFRKAAENLGKAAQKKNLDAAALANLRVTMSCINCHRTLREKKLVQKPSKETLYVRLR